jgi:VWFA-related protein
MRIRWSSAVCLALLSASWLQAQTESFEDRARVLEVRIPVHVVDRSGAPVRDLSVEDFKVFDEKKRREVLDFEVVDLAEIDANTVTEAETTLSGAARRHFLLLFDMSFSSRAALRVARLAARDFVLEGLHPTDLVAVATHSIDRGGRILASFTIDRAQVARAIDTLETADLVDAAGGDPLRLMIAAPDSAIAAPDRMAEEMQQGESSGVNDAGDDGTLWLLGKEMQKAERSQARGRVGSWAESLGELGDMLGVIAGTKQVLYFSEGFDGDLFLGQEAAAVDSADPEAEGGLERWWQRTSLDDAMFGDSSLRGDVDRLLARFSQAGCVLHTLDISPGAAGSAEQRARRARRHTLYYLAEGTGGEMYDASGGAAPQLREIGERTSLTYLLTFAAETTDPPGTFRRVRVKADLAKGGRLSYRNGYRVPRPFAELHPMEKSLLAVEAITSPDEASAVEVSLLTAPFRAGQSAAYVPVVVEIDGQTLLEEHPPGLLPLEIYAYATSSEGEMADFFSQIIGLEIEPRSQLAQGGVKYYGHLELGPGEYLVRILARNAATGRSGVAANTLFVPSFDPGERFVLPPFFFENRTDWLLLREQLPEEERQAGSVVYPFTVDGAPYVPAALPSLQSGESAQLCLVAYNFDADDVDVEGTILDAEGKVLQEDVLAGIERTITGVRDLDKITASFLPQSLAPGDYTLRVELIDAATGSTEIETVGFRIVGS